MVKSKTLFINRINGTGEALYSHVRMVARCNDHENWDHMADISGDCLSHLIYAMPVACVKQSKLSGDLTV